MPEFDRLAENYRAGFDDPVKGWLGRSPQEFLRPKIERLLKLGKASSGRAMRLLDFGCGTGDFLAALSPETPDWELEGCDISDGMLAEAKRRYPNPTFRLWNSAGVPWPAARYDIVTAVCVLHHVPPNDWRTTLDKLINALRPGGLLVVFEHNPWNPITSWMIRRTEVDRNAMLLSASTLENLLTATECKIVAKEFLLFFPPRCRWLLSAESHLRNVPFGGQYLIAVRKP